MNYEGLGWAPSDIRQAQLLEWIIARQDANTYVPVEAFYDALPDQGANDDIAYADLKLLEEQGLLDLALGMGGVGAFDARAGAAGRLLAEQRRAARASRSRRRAAARVALLDWLLAVDALSEFNMPARGSMLESHEHGYWFGQPFTEDDLDQASDWLARNNFVSGVLVDQFAGPIRLRLLDAGVICAEKYDADPERYAQAERQQTAGSYIISFGGDNYGQVAGHNARQEQHNTTAAAAEELRNQIVALAALVRTFAPQATDVDAQQAAALTAAQDRAVDKLALQRFGEWAKSVVMQGVNAAVVPAVSASVTAMMLEAGRLTGHI